MRAAGYVRVSTGRQAELGASLDAQKREIAGYVAAKGWKLVDMASDAASGGSLKRRPGLEGVLARLDAGELDALVVAKLDRLSRSTLDFSGVMERAARYGWTLVVIDLGMDLSTMHGEFAANIWAAVGQFERRMISQRIRDAIGERKEQGTYRGGRALPQGSPLAGPAVSRVMALASDGLSLRGIARQLELEGVPTARGGRWDAQTVRRVLLREQEQDPSTVAGA